MSEDPIIAGVTSYVSLLAAQEIASARLFNEVWTTAPSSRCVQALQTATAMLDRMAWAGERKMASQPLAWPRTGLRDHRGIPLPADMLPAPVAAACVELAIHLLNAGQMPGAPLQMRQLGDAMTMYFPTIADELPKHVRRSIEPYLRVSSANNAEVRL